MLSTGSKHAFHAVLTPLPCDSHVVICAPPKAQEEVSAKGHAPAQTQITFSCLHLLQLPACLSWVRMNSHWLFGIVCCASSGKPVRAQGDAEARAWHQVCA